MEHLLTLDQLLGFIRRSGLKTEPYFSQQLQQYAALIENWSERQSLVSRRDRAYLYEHHFLPVFFFLTRISSFPGKQLVDLGSGAGFLAVLIRLVYPEMAVTAIDSSRKKCLFLQEVDQQLNLGMKIVNDRFESAVLQSASKFDYVVSRGVTGVRDLWIWAEPRLNNSGRLIVLKGGASRSRDLLPEQPGYKIRKIHPDKSWLKFTPYLNGKFLVEVELRND